MCMYICNKEHNKTSIQLTLSGGIESCLHGNGAFDVSTEALDEEDTDRDDTAIEDTISGDTFRRSGDSAAVAIEDDELPLSFLSNAEIMIYINFSLLSSKQATG